MKKEVTFMLGQNKTVGEKDSCSVFARARNQIRPAPQSHLFVSPMERSAAMMAAGLVADEFYREVDEEKLWKQ